MKFTLKGEKQELGFDLTRILEIRKVIPTKLVRL